MNETEKIEQRFCRRCRGTGVIKVKYSITCLTDSDGEIDAAYYYEPCLECWPDFPEYS